MLRSAFSVLAGFATWTILWLTTNQFIVRLFPGRFSEDMVSSDSLILLFLLICSVLFSIFSGWVTVAIASRRPLTHALALGIVQLTVGILVQLQYWQVMPLWYHLSFLILLLPGNVVGGWARSR